MNTKTLVIAAVVIAATASLALAPTLVTTAMADAGGINHIECMHKGTGGECTKEAGKSTITTCKNHGVEGSTDCD